MIQWLKNNAPYCKVDDYVMIWNNLPNWAGTSDTAQLRSAVIEGYTEALARDKK